MSFYKSPRWERVRARVLRRDEYLCRECSRYGRRSTATTVHHIRPREQYPELEYEADNLLSLCTQCHNAMHNRDGDTLSARGQELCARSPHPKPKALNS